MSDKLIAIWSNPNGRQALPYGYGPEQARVADADPTRLLVTYDPGTNTKILNELRTRISDPGGKQGIYFQMMRGYWTKIGTILWAEQGEDGIFTLVLEKQVRVLAKNKPDALGCLNYTKVMGKGTGAYSRGACCIKPLENLA